MARSITIRGQALAVHDALHRSPGHTPGESQAYNEKPTLERPADVVAAITPRG